MHCIFLDFITCICCVHLLCVWGWFFTQPRRRNPGFCPKDGKAMIVKCSATRTSEVADPVSSNFEIFGAFNRDLRWLICTWLILSGGWGGLKPANGTIGTKMSSLFLSRPRQNAWFLGKDMQRNGFWDPQQMIRVDSSCFFWRGNVLEECADASPQFCGLLWQSCWNTCFISQSYFATANFGYVDVRTLNFRMPMDASPLTIRSDLWQACSPSRQSEESCATDWQSHRRPPTFATGSYCSKNGLWIWVNTY